VADTLDCQDREADGQRGLCGVLLSQPGEPRGQLSWEIDTVADRFRNLSQARLSSDFPRPAVVGGPLTGPSLGNSLQGRSVSRLEMGQRLAQSLADAAAGVAARAAQRPPASRAVPAIHPFAVGEQIAVTGHELLLQLEGLPDDELVWDDDRRMSVADLVNRTISMLKEIRLTL
jgi:hypothetical protein